MDVKKSARRFATMYIESIKGLEYFRINKDFSWEQIRQPAVKDNNFIKRRKRFEKERKFMDSMLPFFAYLSAPDNAAANSVIGSSFEKYRKLIDKQMKMQGIKTMGHGFLVGEERKAINAEYDRYERRFVTIAQAIESYVKSQ